MDRLDFYYNQTLLDGDLDLLEDNIESAIKNVITDTFAQGIVTGLTVVQNGTPNATVLVNTGIAYDNTNQRVKLLTQQSVDLAASIPGSNARISSIVIKFGRVLSDTRTDGYGTTINYHQDESFQILVVDGSISATPSAPAIASDQVMLADVLLTTGMSQIYNASISTARVSRILKFDKSVVYNVAQGFIKGLPISNNGVTPNTKVDIGAGSALDSTNAYLLTLSSTLIGILQASGAWAAGDNQNKLDTGARTNSSTYHIYVIRKDSDGTCDILFSLSATAPTMPTGYTYKRMIGCILTDGSGNIYQGTWFKYDGILQFYFIDIQIPMDGVAVSTVGALYGLIVPNGVQCLAFGVISPGVATGSSDVPISMNTPASNYQTGSNNPMNSVFRGVAAGMNGGAYQFATATQFEILTNTSREIKLKRVGTYQAASSQTTMQQWGYKQFI